MNTLKELKKQAEKYKGQKEFDIEDATDTLGDILNAYMDEFCTGDDDSIIFGSVSSELGAVSSLIKGNIDSVAALIATMASEREGVGLAVKIAAKHIYDDAE